ncbi:MAG: hypothetical protein ACRDPH_02495 [Marmoricola sp.]
MRKAVRLLAPLAVAAVPLALAPGASFASGGSTYQTTLNPLNNQSGSGMATVQLHGNSATVTVDYTGLATTFKGGPFPHVQHIHIDGRGQCPTMADDKSGDGVISTPEGQPDYGAIGTTLSTKGSTSASQGTNIKVAPAGGSASYHRTFKLNSKSLQSVRNGTGVIVVHGLDPATMPKKAQTEKSPLVPSLPLAATAPALCGALSTMPAGGVATGNGSTAGIEDAGLLGLGGGLLAAGTGVALYSVRRRRNNAAA